MASPLLSFLFGSLGISLTFLVSKLLSTKMPNCRCITYPVIEFIIVVVWLSSKSSMLVTCIY